MKFIFNVQNDGPMIVSNKMIDFKRGDKIEAVMLNNKLYLLFKNGDKIHLDRAMFGALHYFGYFENMDIYAYFTNSKISHLMTMEPHQEIQKFGISDRRYNGLFTNRISSETFFYKWVFMHGDLYPVYIEDSSVPKSVCLKEFPVNIPTVKMLNPVFRNQGFNAILHLNEKILITDKPGLFFRSDLSAKDYKVLVNIEKGICYINFTRVSCKLLDILKYGVIELSGTFYQPINCYDTTTPFSSLYYTKYSGKCQIYEKYENPVITKENYMESKSFVILNRVNPVANLISNIEKGPNYNGFEVAITDILNHNKDYWKSQLYCQEDYECFETGFKRFARLIGLIEITDDSACQLIHFIRLLSDIPKKQKDITIEIKESSKGPRYSYRHCKKIRINDGRMEFSFHSLNESIPLYHNNIHYDDIECPNITENEKLSWIELFRSPNANHFIKTTVYQDGHYKKDFRQNSEKRLVYDADSFKFFDNDELMVSGGKDKETRIYKRHDIYEGTEEEVYNGCMELLKVSEKDCSGQEIYSKNMITGDERAKYLSVKTENIVVMTL